MTKVVHVPLSVHGIENAIKETKKYKEWLKEKSRLLLEQLTQQGFSIASANFARAVYDGSNDVSVSIRQDGIHTRAIVAVGASVLFIEFGTGIVYPDNHPEAAVHGMRRGGYGKGHGNQTAWGYYGNPGTNGQVVTKKNGNSVVITHGNPANMCMYDTAKQLEMLLPRMAREVFQ